MRNTYHTLQITGRWPSPARAVEAAPAAVSADESDTEEPADAVVTS